MDRDYADDIVLLANTPTQAESVLHSLKQALHMNADKTQYIFFNQDRDISTLKVVDKFMYLGNSILSTKSLQ